LETTKIIIINLTFKFTSFTVILCLSHRSDNTQCRNTTLFYAEATGTAMCHNIPIPRFQFPEGARDFSVLESIHNSSGTHPACHSKSTRNSFQGSNVADARC
jgi:hypothetical protein